MLWDMNEQKFHNCFFQGLLNITLQHDVASHWGQSSWLGGKLIQPTHVVSMFQANEQKCYCLLQ